jgi:amidase
VASLQTGCAPSAAPPLASQAAHGEIHYLSLREVSELIASRRVSPVALTQMMLDRIDTLDGRLHSYARVMADSALAAAAAAEREIEVGHYRGPLHGVPVAVKDLCFTQGVPTMGGMRVLRDFVPEYNATVVAKLEAAGAILLGKLNLTEGAMVGYHRDFEIPVNPWGEELWAGVSSSGSGVATAAGLCFASIGTDTGGSIRFPSMANGTVGLKPTYGRVSRHGVLPLAESLDHVGPMTRSVADAAIMLEAIAGYDPDDQSSLRDPVADLLGQLDRGVAGLRVGFDRAYALDGIDAGLARAIDAAKAHLQSLGATIVEVEIPDLSDVLPAWPIICAAEAVHAHRQHYPARADEFGAYFREFLEFGAGISAAQLAQARNIRARFSEQFRATLSTVDAILSPAAGAPFAVAPGLQYGSMTEWNQASRTRNQALGLTKPYTAFTFPHDLAGTPALAMPCGMSEQGLPYTMQLAGSPLSEAMLCRIGHAYEQSTPWHGRHPPV